VEVVNTPSPNAAAPNPPLVVTLDARFAGIVTAWNQALQQAHLAGGSLALTVCDFNYKAVRQSTYAGALLAQLGQLPASTRFDATFTYQTAIYRPVTGSCVPPTSKY
jgi:hypothetical protein